MLQLVTNWSNKSPRDILQIDSDYREKVAELAKTREKRQKEMKVLKEELTLKTWELINSKTGDEINCPDCHRKFHRGGGLVNHRLNFCKKLQLGNI